jgi:hypothetical protein
MPKHDDIKKTIKYVYEDIGALDILLQFEDILEKSGLYVYPNWELGEVIDGPVIERHWVDVSLMYPYKKMPEPEGAMRLVKIGCKVFFGKDVYKEPTRVYGPEDIRDPHTKKAKLIPHKVWVVKIRIPKRLIEQEMEEYMGLSDLDIGVDTNDLDAAYVDDIPTDDIDMGSADEFDVEGSNDSWLNGDEGDRT